MTFLSLFFLKDCRTSKWSRKRCTTHLVYL